MFKIAWRTKPSREVPQIREIFRSRNVFNKKNVGKVLFVTRAKAFGTLEGLMFYNNLMHSVNITKVLKRLSPRLDYTF